MNIVFICERLQRLGRGLTGSGDIFLQMLEYLLDFSLRKVDVVDLREIGSGRGRNCKANSAGYQSPFGSGEIWPLFVAKPAVPRRPLGAWRLSVPPGKPLCVLLPECTPLAGRASNGLGDTDKRGERLRFDIENSTRQGRWRFEQAARRRGRGSLRLYAKFL